MPRLVLPPVAPAKVIPGDERTPMERATAMCELIAGGKSLRAAAKAEGLSHASFLGLVKADATLAIAYQAAIEAGLEAQLSDLDQEALTVMRTARSMGRLGQSAGPYVAAFGHRYNVTKLRMEKQAPKKYGPRVDHTLSGPNGGPVEFTKIERTIVDPAAPKA